MHLTNDIEYNELLNKLIEKKEKQYGDGWASAWGAIRNQTKKVYEFWYNKYGRDNAIERIKVQLNK